MCGGRSRPLVGLLMLAGALGACNLPPKLDPAASPTHWDQTRLCATLQLADQQIAAGKFERARASLAAFNGLSDARLQLTLARIDVEEGRYADALRRLDLIGGTTVDAAAYHRLRAVALEGAGYWSAAATAYETAYQYEKTAAALVAWLETLVLDGQAETARAIIDRERDQFPGEPAIHVFAARLSELEGDTDTEINELTTAALAEPESTEIRRRLARAYTTAGRHAEAAPIWEKLVAESTDSDRRQKLRRHLADSLLASGSVAKARHVYRALVLTQPEDDAAWLGLATACLLDDTPAEALEAALNVLNADPGDTQDTPTSGTARLIAAMCYQRLNQPARAIELLSDIGRNSDLDGLARRLRQHWQ